MNQDLKTVVKWGVDFGEEIDNALSNGWQWADLTKFLDDFFSAPAMVKAAPGALVVLKEGLSDEDRAEVVEFVKLELDIPHEEAEKKAEGIVEWMLATDKFIRLFLKKKNA